MGEWGDIKITITDVIRSGQQLIAEWVMTRVMVRVRFSEGLEGDTWSFFLM